MIREQSDFLPGRSIHDAVAITQEVMHSINSKNLNVGIIKIDLNKAYDRVDWSFIKLILYKIGLTSDSVDSIVRCISSSSIFVIINGMTSNFFRPRRGLRQGCALSPLLFILVMDALSLNIKRDVTTGEFSGLNISEKDATSHSFFVDDVLIFGLMIISNWRRLGQIFNNFYYASGMEANNSKSCFYHSEGSPEVV